MKTKILGAVVIAGTIAISTTGMAQDTTKTKMEADTLSQIRREVPQMMGKMDTNRDGMVSMNEAKAAGDQKLYKSFKQADTSGDGMIDAREFMAYEEMGEDGASLEDRGTMMTGDTLSGMNRDSTEIMDPMDDEAGNMGSAGNTEDQQLRKSFEMADTSGDGMVDIGEFMAYEKKAKDGRIMEGENMDNIKKGDSIDH